MLKWKCKENFWTTYFQSRQDDLTELYILCFHFLFYFGMWLCSFTSCWGWLQLMSCTCVPPQCSSAHHTAHCISSWCPSLSLGQQWSLGWNVFGSLQWTSSLWSGWSCVRRWNPAAMKQTQDYPSRCLPIGWTGVPGGWFQAYLA